MGWMERCCRSAGGGLRSSGRGHPAGICGSRRMGWRVCARLRCARAPSACDGALRLSMMRDDGEDLRMPLPRHGEGALRARVRVDCRWSVGAIRSSADLRRRSSMECSRSGEAVDRRGGVIGSALGMGERVLQTRDDFLRRSPRAPQLAARGRPSAARRLKGDLPAHRTARRARC